MATDPQTLTFAPAMWGSQAEPWLSQATGHDSLSDIREQVTSGAARLFYIMAGADTVGAFVLRVDTTARGPQGVMVAFAAKLQGVDMIASCLPAIEGMFVGCTSIRYHTNRAALARRLAGMGYRAAEIVSIKEI
jgi:hypothetical protein